MNLEACEWSEAFPKLAPALGDYASEAIREVQAGREAVYRIGDSFALLRVEQYPSGDLELVVVGLAGELKAGTLATFEYGRQLGCRYIRCHTQRPAQLRFFRMMGLPVFDDGKDEDGFLMIKADYGREE
ncbi:hypothetical protein [Photobacterium satsumensis]|uniref:hypothetical protein n=1 Tax=Photobacterium satsumensis TaxID=2910239 RepID=UPI003D0DF548